MSSAVPHYTDLVYYAPSAPSAPPYEATELGDAVNYGTTKDDMEAQCPGPVHYEVLGRTATGQSQGSNSEMDSGMERTRSHWQVDRTDSFEQKYRQRCNEVYAEATSDELGERGYNLGNKLQDDSSTGNYVMPAEAVRDHVRAFGSAEEFFQHSQRTIQNRFIAKVYLILSLQLGFTFGWTLFTMYSGTGVGQWCIDNYNWAFWVSFAVEMVCLVALICCYQRHYPINVVLMTLFTIALSYMMGSLAASYQESGNGEVIVMAWGVATLLFVGLSLFTFVNPCRINFASWGTGLFALLWVLIVWGFFMAIFGTGELMYKIYCLLGCLVFMAYICYDTYLLIKVFGPGDEFMCAISLYLDVINLVLMLVGLAGRK